MYFLSSNLGFVAIRKMRPYSSYNGKSKTRPSGKTNYTKQINEYTLLKFSIRVDSDPV